MRMNLTNFIVRVISNNLKLHWFLFNCALWLFLGKLAPSSQPINCKTKTSSDGFICIFPRFRMMTCICLSPWWLLVVFSFVLIDCCYDLNCGFIAVIANGAQKYTFYLTNFFTNNAFMEMIQLFVERKMNSIERSTFVVYASAHSLGGGGGGGRTARWWVNKVEREVHRLLLGYLW